MIQSEALLCQRIRALPNFIGGTLRLNRKYSGPILQIYNGTTTQDVGSVKDIAAFCGASNGFVSKVYDQSGNGRDMSQATTANQPKIYDGATTSLLRSNTRSPVVMRFNGTSDFLSRSDGCGLSGTNQTVSVWHLAKVASGSGGYSYWGTTGTANGDFTAQYVTNLGGTGKNVPRITCNPDGVYFSDSSFVGTVSLAYHDDIAEASVTGFITAAGTWTLNGSSLASTAETVPTAGPNYNNAGSGIGSRTAGNLPLNGDISCVGMWNPKLTAADKTVLLKFGERWRVQ